MEEQEIKIIIETKASDMAKALSNGKEIEIRTAKDGIVIYTNDRKKIK